MAGDYHYDERTDGGLTVSLEEGNYTYTEKQLLRNGLYDEGASLVSEITDGMAVQIYTGADNTVQIASSGIHVGRIDGDPRGGFPAVSKTSGNYTRRVGNLILPPGWELVTLRLNATHAAITSGDYLALASDKKTYVKEEDTTSNIIAFQSKSENSGEWIECLQKGAPAAAAD